MPAKIFLTMDMATASLSEIQAAILRCDDLEGLDKAKKLDEVDTGGKPVAVIMCGPPASGKTTMRQNSSAMKKLDSIDNDDIKKEINEGKVKALGSDGKPLEGRWTLKPSNPSEVAINNDIHKAAGKVVEQRWAEALAAGKPILMDTVGAWKDHVTRLVKEAKAAGYHVHLALKYRDKQSCLAGNRARPRSVPESALTERHDNLTKNWPEYPEIDGVDSVEKDTSEPKPK